VVASGYPHHVTQRGNRRQKTFFGDADYAAYLELMADCCGRCGVEVWADSGAQRTDETVVAQWPAAVT